MTWLFVHHLSDTKNVPALYFLYMVLDITYFLGLELSICVFEHNSGPSVLFKLILFCGNIFRICYISEFMKALKLANRQYAWKRFNSASPILGLRTSNLR